MIRRKRSPIEDYLRGIADEWTGGGVLSAPGPAAYDSGSDESFDGAGNSSYEEAPPARQIPVRQTPARRTPARQNPASSLKQPTPRTPPGSGALKVTARVQHKTPEQAKPVAAASAPAPSVPASSTAAPSAREHSRIMTDGGHKVYKSATGREYVKSDKGKPTFIKMGAESLVKKDAAK